MAGTSLNNNKPDNSSALFCGLCLLRRKQSGGQLSQQQLARSQQWDDCLFSLLLREVTPTRPLFVCFLSVSGLMFFFNSHTRN